MLVLKPSLPDSEIISNVRRSREKSVFPVLELYGPQYRKLTALFCQILYFLIYENRNNLKTLVSCIIVWIDIQLNLRFLTVYRPKINKQNQLKNNLKIIDFFYLWNSKTCFQQFAWQLFFFYLRDFKLRLLSCAIHNQKNLKLFSDPISKCSVFIPFGNHQSIGIRFLSQFHFAILSKKG